MRDECKLSDLARAEIETLQADGVALTPENIVRINALSWEVESPQSRALLSRGVPVFIGEVMLWPLTIHAADWFQRSCNQGDVQWQTLCLAYAMTFGRSSGPELDVEGERVYKTVLKWARSAFRRVRFDEVTEAIYQVLQQDTTEDDPPSKNDGGMLPGELSALLVSAVGGSPEMWERQVSIGYVRAVLTATAQQNKADGKPCASDPRIVATRALGWEIECIRNPELRAKTGGQ